MKCKLSAGLRDKAINVFLPVLDLDFWDKSTSAILKRLKRHHFISGDGTSDLDCETSRLSVQMHLENSTQEQGQRTHFGAYNHTH